MINGNQESVTETVEYTSERLPLFVDPETLTNYWNTNKLLSENHRLDCAKGSLTVVAIVQLLLGIFSCMTAFITSVAGLMSIAVTSLPLYTSFRYFRYVPENQTCIACRTQMNTFGECHGNARLEQCKKCNVKRYDRPVISGMEFGKLSSCVPIEFTVKNIASVIVGVHATNSIGAIFAAVALSASRCVGDQLGKKVRAE